MCIIVIPTPSVSVNASVATSIATCIGIYCDAWEWGGGYRFLSILSITMYANTMLTLTLPLLLGVGRPLFLTISSSGNRYKLINILGFFSVFFFFVVFIGWIAERKNTAKDALQEEAGLTYGKEK